LGNAHACPPGTNRVGERLRHVPQQPDAVFDRAAICVKTVVRNILQKLVDEITKSAM